MKDAEVLAEHVSYVIDTVTGKVVDLIWSRVFGNEWRIFHEHYSEHADAVSNRATPMPHRFVTRSVMTLDKISAEALFTGLKKHILPKNFSTGR